MAAFDVEVGVEVEVEVEGGDMLTSGSGSEVGSAVDMDGTARRRVEEAEEESACWP